MSEIKVNKITPRTACGTTQLGDSGDTFTIPSGATITNAGTATGFGATGETSWDTTVKTTGTFTATAGVGYFLNTTGGVITVNLPVGAAGSSVALADYAGTWQTDNVTVAANGTEKIGGVDADVTLSTEGQSVTFVYIDGTQGWVNVLDSTSNVRGSSYIVATGGTPCSGSIVCTNYKVHKFTGPGTFCVSAGAGPLAFVDYLVVAGGGGGGQANPMPYSAGGGGGGGGFRESKVAATSGCWTASPLAAAVSLPVSVSPYAVEVGGGGPVNTVGVNSSFSTITSAGGGEGGCGPSAPFAGGNGGSGGGGAYGATCTEGTGNTPSQVPAQGTDGGSANACNGAGAGGGGATVAATNVGSPASTAGGAGATTSISATPTAYAGGGGGGNDTPSQQGAGGTGGGGAGGSPSTGGGATAGTVNTGGAGGGSGAANPSTGGAGGSGIVYIRYKFQ